MRNTRPDEAKAEIKIARRNINNLRYGDDTTLMEESEEELKSLLMKVNEESEKAGWKFNIQKSKIMASSPITSWQIDGETLETVTDFIFLGFKIITDGDCNYEIKRQFSLEERLWKHIQYIKKQRHYFANKGPYQFSSVQSLSHVRLLATPWTAAHQASVSITNNSWSLPKLMSFESVMPSNHLIFCHPHLLLPSTFPSIRVFSNELPLSIRWPKYWSFSFNISHSSEHLGLISFRMDRLDLLAVQGTLKSLLQHNSSKASILQHSAFFTVQLLHPYMTTGQTIALTRQTFVGKVLSLLFNMLSRLVITFLPRSKHP